MSELDKAVEAGAVAWFDHNQAIRRDAGAFDAAGNRWTWDSAGPNEKTAYRELARPIVFAAIASWESREEG